MNLGELEFKTDDFVPMIKMQGHCKEVADVFGLELSHVANRILAEKLRKAPQMWMAKGYGHFDIWRPENTELDGPATHTARLVCLEEVGE